MQIRKELPADHEPIHNLTRIAFEPLSISDGSEPHIIDQLRAAGDLTLSLVAVNNTELVGHAAFSPVVVGQHKAGWFGLGPISVHPDRQRQGIGSSLIKEGLQTLRTLKAQGCVLIGDPNYYSRFGFTSDVLIQYQEIPAKYVQWLGFGDSIPSGEIIYRPAFGP